MQTTPIHQPLAAPIAEVSLAPTGVTELEQTVGAEMITLGKPSRAVRQHLYRQGILSIYTRALIDVDTICTRPSDPNWRPKRAAKRKGTHKPAIDNSPSRFVRARSVVSADPADPRTRTERRRAERREAKDKWRAERAAARLNA
jgi:hypothetical protein